MHSPAAVRLVEPEATPSLFSRFLAQRHFPGLDGVRALSVIGVIWYHCTPGHFRGYYGVDAFFVLSGFLIATLLLREQTATGTIDLRRFYLRRALRIFPPYYALLLVLVLHYTVSPGARADRFFGDLPFLLTYMTDFFPAGGFLTITWSLAAEEKFYLLWPSLQKHLRRSHALLFLGAFLLLNELILCRVFVLDEGSRTVLKYTFAPIVIGVLAAYALHDANIFTRLASSPIPKTASQLLFGAVIAVLLVGPKEPAWLRVVLHIAMCGLLFGTILRNDSWFVRVLEWAPLRRIGRVSYGMYLFHKIPMAFLYGVFPPLETTAQILLYIAGSVALSYAMAEVSFRTLEAFARKWKERLT